MIYRKIAHLFEINQAVLVQKTGRRQYQADHRVAIHLPRMAVRPPKSLGICNDFAVVQLLFNLREDTVCGVERKAMSNEQKTG